MFERFTENARTVVVLAQQDARERGDSAIDTGHVLRALLAVPDNLALMVLEGFSVRRADLEADLAGRAATPSAAGSVEDADALAALGIDLDEVRRRIEEAFGPGALDRARAPEAALPRRPHPVRQGVEEGSGAVAARGAGAAGTTTSARSTCCWGCCTARAPPTTCWWREGCCWTSRG